MEHGFQKAQPAFVTEHGELASFDFIFYEVGTQWQCYSSRLIVKMKSNKVLRCFMNCKAL